MRYKALALWHEVDLNGREKVVILRERREDYDINTRSYVPTPSSRKRVTSLAASLAGGGVKGWYCCPNRVDRNILVGWGIHAPRAVYPPPTGE